MIKKIAYWTQLNLTFGLLKSASIKEDKRFKYNFRWFSGSMHINRFWWIIEYKYIIHQSGKLCFESLVF